MPGRPLCPPDSTLSGTPDATCPVSLHVDWSERHPFLALLRGSECSGEACKASSSLGDVQLLGPRPHPQGQHLLAVRLEVVFMLANI